MAPYNVASNAPQLLTTTAEQKTDVWRHQIRGLDFCKTFLAKKKGGHWVNFQKESVKVKKGRILKDFQS